jgi:hypothetical protein
VLGQEVYDLPLPFIAPLGSDNNYDGHLSLRIRASLNPACKVLPAISARVTQENRRRWARECFVGERNSSIEKRGPAWA